MTRWNGDGGLGRESGIWCPGRVTGQCLISNVYVSHTMQLKDGQLRPDTQTVSHCEKRAVFLKLSTDDLKALRMAYYTFKR